MPWQKFSHNPWKRWNQLVHLVDYKGWNPDRLLGGTEIPTTEEVRQTLETLAGPGIRRSELEFGWQWKPEPYEEREPRRKPNMLPTDLGLPAKFTGFYPEQFNTAVEIAASDKRFFVDAAPTGFGKSLMYMAVAQLLDARTVVLTANKGLQQQLSGDFAPIGLVDIRGQANYPCRALDQKGKYHGCDQGPCHHGKVCELHPRHNPVQSSGHRLRFPGCDFYDALDRARDSRLLVTNYDFWMSVNRFMDPGVLGKTDLLILDEAHDAPDKLADFCSVTLTKDECTEYLGSDLPPIEEGTEAWALWARMHLPALEAKLKKQQDYVSEEPETTKEMADLANKLEFMESAHEWERAEPTEPTISMPGVSNDWVAERGFNGKSATFSPIWAHRYSERFLFSGVPKVLLVSATVLPITADYLGIRRVDSTFREHQSGFHPERRPVYVIPTPRMGRNATDVDYRAWMVKIDQIIADRLDRKGIIHTVSYKIADFIVEHSAHRDKMDWCKRDRHGWGREAARDVVDRFKNRVGPSILVGAAFDTGFDFPYDQCEYQIIAKMPFIDSRSKVVEARAKSDKKYLNYAAALRLIQACGRGMRAADDTCETFIVDGNISWFMHAAKELMPKWFKAAFRWVDFLPKPMKKIVRPR